MYLTGLTDITAKMSISADDSEDLMPLIDRCIQEDRTAQTQLYEEFAPFVKGVVKRYIPDAETAKDLLNEIFYRVFLKLHLYKPTGPFKGWVRTLAVNVIVDHVRKNTKHKDVEVKDFTDHEVYVPDDIASKVNYKDLLLIIASLPDTHRTIFNLFVFESLTHAEIATLMGISVNNSRWHLSEARNKLKQKLEKLL